MSNQGPPWLPIHYDKSTPLQGAYHRCLAVERAIPNSPPKSGPSDLVYVRVLGHLIHHGPGDVARANVAIEVISCKTDEEIVTLGKFYYEHFVRPHTAVKASRRRIPTAYNQISPPSFATLKEMIKAMLAEAASDHRLARNKVLVRDGFRCVVSGRLDSTIVERCPELEEQFIAQDLSATLTQCAHIFPESTNFNISGENEGGAKRDYAASIWAVMDRFGYPSICNDLNGPGIHCLENVMTMDPAIHSWFDSLKIWFEATDTPNYYKLDAVRPFFLMNLATHVAFKAAEGLDGTASILPSPIYLGIHAACAKVAHLSGAAEHIDNVLRELEEIDVLAQNGASAEALDYAIMRNGIAAHLDGLYDG